MKILLILYHPRPNKIDPIFCEIYTRIPNGLMISRSNAKKPTLVAYILLDYTKSLIS